MLTTLSYQMYKYEHGLYITAAERRAADVRAGEVAAALRDLRRRLGDVLRLGHRARPVRAVAGTRAACSARVLSDVR
jgi:hypothetical protein